MYLVKTNVLKIELDWSIRPSVGDLSDLVYPFKLTTY